MIATALSVLLILLGGFGLLTAGMAFGDIGIAAGIGGGAALLSGVTLFNISRRVSKLEKD